MHLKRKQKGRRGFSLAETMLAVLILLMVSVIVATGVPVAKNAYEKVVFGANAQVLLSTAVNALRDELGTAWDVEVKSNEVTYCNSDTGAHSILKLNDKNNIVRQRYIDNSDSSGAHALVSDAAAENKRLVVTYTEAKQDGKTVCFSGLRVCMANDMASSLAGPIDLNIRVVSFK